MIEFKIEYDEKELNKILDQVEVEFQRAIYESGLAEVGKFLQKAITAEAKATANSSASGSRRKWSNKTKAARANVKPLSDSIGYKVIKAKNNRPSSVLVGPKRPDGNIAHFIAPGRKHTRKKVLWGRQTGEVVAKTNDFVRRAVDENKAQIGRVFARGTERGLKRRLRALGRG